MTRIDGWENKLETYLLGRAEQKLVWGSTDCCMFVADSIKAVTDVDVALYFRGKYNRMRAAYAMLKRYSGGGSVQETWEKLALEYNMTKIESKDLQAGDIVTMRAEAHNAVAGRLSNGVTVGVQSFDAGILSQGPNGVMLTQEPEIVSAWKI